MLISPLCEEATGGRERTTKKGASRKIPGAYKEQEVVCVLTTQDGSVLQYWGIGLKSQKGISASVMRQSSP